MKKILTLVLTLVLFAGIPQVIFADEEPSGNKENESSRILLELAKENPKLAGEFATYLEKKGGEVDVEKEFAKFLQERKEDKVVLDLLPIILFPLLILAGFFFAVVGFFFGGTIFKNH